MKKPEEIKLGLECCGKDCVGRECVKCPYKDTTWYCDDHVSNDALALIRQLEEEKAALIEALRNSDQDCEYCKHAKVYGQFCEEEEFSCSDCKVFEQCPCVKCNRQNKQWEWCGLPGDAGGEANGRS